MNLPIVDIERFERLEVLAQTNQSTVHKARDTLTHALVVIKELRGNYSDPRFQTRFIHEVGNMVMLQHPAILNAIGCNLSPFLIVIPYCQNGNLTSYIRQEQVAIKTRATMQNPEYDITMKAKICLGVASAISFLHSQGIAHRDIKPDNVLINETYEPQLMDFGLSLNANFDDISSTTSESGTPLFMAPEQHNPEDQFQIEDFQKCDIYSFGMLMYCIFNSTDNPYPGITSVYYLANHVIRGNRPQFPGDDLDLSHTTQQRRFISTIIRNLIEQCWSNSPAERPSFDQILETLMKPSIYGPNLNREDFNEYVAKLGLSISIPSQSHEEEEEVEDIAALYQEAISFIEGTSDRGQDIQRGINLLNQICNENNYVPALLYMNKLIWEGRHVERDLNLANRYLRAAADQRDIRAINYYTMSLTTRLNRLYRRNGNNRNAIIWLRRERNRYLHKGVRLGDPQSMAVLAREYVRRRNYEDAILLLENSIRIASNPMAYFIMGGLFESGHYYQVDIERAISYYRNSAGYSYMPAIQALERLGVSPDPHVIARVTVDTQQQRNNNLQDLIRIRYQTSDEDSQISDDDIDTSDDDIQIRGRGNNQNRGRGNSQSRGGRNDQLGDEDIQNQDYRNYQIRGHGNNQNRGNNRIRGRGN